MKLAIVFFFAVLLSTSCSSSGVQMKESSALPMPDRTQVEPAREVQISPRDTVEVRVFGIEDLSGDFDVDQSGMVKLPLIGAIEAEGLTAIEFATKVERALEVSYLQDADVTVLVEPYALRVVTLDGALKRPGRYEVQGPTSLLKAIAMGGGTSRHANTNRVVIFREINGQRMAAGFDLNKIRLGTAADPEVFGNDIIVVADSGTRRTYGDIIQSIPLVGLYLRADGVGN